MTCSGCHAPRSAHFCAAYARSFTPLYSRSSLARSGLKSDPSTHLSPRVRIIVLTHPGTSRKAFTWQPAVERNLCCSASVRTLTPALLTLYAVSPGGIVMPCLEPVFTTTAGSACSIMCGTNARPPRKTPHRLVSRIVRHRSACSYGPHRLFDWIAALFISRCTFPKALKAATCAARTSASRRQSHCCTRTSASPAPAAMHSSRTEAASAVSMSASMTFMP
mmetsp:Transcript_55648/g.124339  ORF Transcript_55648/g.124339 Transcript_55648/m.124339 type:complete len:221 (+) Transcript_55648:369-1031(+)